MDTPHTIMNDRMRRWDKLGARLVEKVFDRNIWVCLCSLKKLFFEILGLETKVNFMTKLYIQCWGTVLF